MAVLGRVRVLVVDDQEDARLLFTLVLEGEGAEVKSCESADEALKVLQQWKPDVILSDLCMPERDGYWLMETVRSLDPDEGGRIPAIAVSARTLPEERRKVVQSGFQAYLLKPFETDKLVAAIRQLAL